MRVVIRCRQGRLSLSGPVFPAGCPVGWEGVEELGDLVQAQADVLRGGDERQAPQDVPGISPLVAGAAGGADQAALLVVAQGGGAEPGAACGLPDPELRWLAHARQGGVRSA
jgi:hypothetical protein